MSENRACDLCSLDVGVKPFVLNTSEKQYQFCCEGCRGIYEMLHDIQETPVQNDKNADKKS
ncbi:MAG: heavy metal translocating P-type ATPase metal-binding domain-containing protein [Ferribacterium limneticum]